MMKKYLLGTALLGSAIFLTACSGTFDNTQAEQPSQEWANWVEAQVDTTDGQGHGPDWGSNEWCHVVEFKLFNRQSGLTPCSPQWQQKVSDTLNHRAQ